MVKSLPAMQETRFRSLGQEDALEKEMTTPPVFLPGKSHGKTTPHGVTESEMTERLPRYNDMSPNREYQ